jgi:hypothetical protein
MNPLKPHKRLRGKWREHPGVPIATSRIAHTYSLRALSQRQRTQNFGANGLNG